jgi:uncharacterized protein YdhG (YjbR/CyaY superfamily)
VHQPTTSTDDAVAAIDAQLATFPDDVRAALQHLRETIRAAAPEAVEAISYAVPAFKYRGRPLVSYSATKRHCAFYVMDPAVLAAHAAELEGYDTSKSTIRFPADGPLPDDLVTRIVRARVAVTDDGLR